MKTLGRLRHTVLLLIAVAAVLVFKTLLLRGSISKPLLFYASSTTDLNETLRRLAAFDPGEAEVRNQAEELLKGYFPSTAFRFVFVRRRKNRREFQLRSLRSRKNFHDFPDLPRNLRQWLLSKRYHTSVMSDILRQLNVSRPYFSCAVVGNSGILLNSDHGQFIDSHDFVIRLNNARIANFQNNVGAKTNLSFINSNILHFCARRSDCFCHPYGESVPIMMYICQAKHFIEYLGCKTSHKAPLIVTDAGFDTLCARMAKYYSLKRFVEETGRWPEEWSKTHDENMFHYSSGMQAVMVALGTCERVSVFGFGKTAGAKHHYHTNQRAELDLHDYEAEYALYRDLAERPETIPFLKESGFRVPPVVFYR